MDSQIIIYQTEDGKTKLDVRLEDETVWLSQKMMAELFQTTVPNVNMHLKNIFKEGELEEKATIKEFLIVRQEGNRRVERKQLLYNLDAIISVGYRIKSHVATKFRQWATNHIREYIVKGFVLDDERLKNPDLPFDYFDREILSHAGKISHELAVSKAESEYGKFHSQRIALCGKLENDFDQAIKNLPIPKKGQ
ncbi:MAG: RhuM family protein [Bacteroidota bacterium]